MFHDDFPNEPPIIKNSFYAEQKAMEKVADVLRPYLQDDGVVSVLHEGSYLSEGAEAVVWAVYVSGERRMIGMPFEVYSAFQELRRVMYKPGVGSWWSVVMTVWPRGRTRTEFNYTDQPAMGLPFGGIAYLTDQRKFPIDEDKQPPRLKDRLADGVADLHKYGKKSYPLWLEQMIEAGKRPDWL